MRRGRREKIRDNGSSKYLIYSSLIILFVIIITFIIVFAIYKRNIKESISSELTAQKIAELVPNETNSALEQASIDIGKSIEEVVKKVEEDNSKIEEKTQTLEENLIEKTTEETTIANVETKIIKDPEFSIPVEGEFVRNFAKDTLIYSETLKEWITHLGIDIKAPRTTVVKSAESGQVVAIKNDPRYGLTIIIEHVNGFKTIYSNLLTTEFVTEGENVEKGQSIGTVGNSAAFEIVDEPHLHFEILKDNQNVDPNIYLK